MLERERPMSLRTYQAIITQKHHCLFPKRMERPAVEVVYIDKDYLDATK